MADFIPIIKQKLNSLFETSFGNIREYAKKVLGMAGKLNKSDLQNICCTIILGVHSVFKFVNLFTGYPPVVEIVVNAFVVGFVAAVFLNMEQLKDILSKRESPSKAIKAEVAVKHVFAYLEDRLRKIYPVMENLKEMEKPLKKLQKNDPEQKLEAMLKEYHNCILSVELNVHECLKDLEFLKPWIEGAIEELNEGSTGKTDSDTETIKSLQQYCFDCDNYKKTLDEIASHVLQRKEGTVKDLIEINKRLKSSCP